MLSLSLGLTVIGAFKVLRQGGDIVAARGVPDRKHAKTPFGNF
jgi:hypothetical protein